MKFHVLLTVLLIAVFQISSGSSHQRKSVIADKQKIFTDKGERIPEQSIVTQFKNSQAIPGSHSELSPQTVCKGYGYFDHLLIEQKQIRNHINIGKSFSAHSGGKIIDNGLKAVVSISRSLKPDETEQRWRAKLRGAASSIQKYNPDDVAWVLIQDEPLLGGFTPRQLRKIVELAKEIIGGEYKYGYTFTRNAILRKDIPDNADVVGTNYYPFLYKEFGDVWIQTEKEFNDYLNLILSKIREKVPGAEISITGQAFYNRDKRKWRKPPEDSPYWYVRAMQRHDDVKWLLWYEWNVRKHRRWIALEEMPDLQASIEGAYEWMCGGLD